MARRRTPPERIREMESLVVRQRSHPSPRKTAPVATTFQRHRISSLCRGHSCEDYGCLQRNGLPKWNNSPHMDAKVLEQQNPTTRCWTSEDSKLKEPESPTWPRQHTLASEYPNKWPGYPMWLNGTYYTWMLPPLREPDSTKRYSPHWQKPIRH